MENASIKLPNNYNLIVGKTYEFTFYTFEDLNDTIEDIFKHAIISTIKESTRSKEEEKMTQS